MCKTVSPLMDEILAARVPTMTALQKALKEDIGKCHLGETTQTGLSGPKAGGSGE